MLSQTLILVLVTAVIVSLRSRHQRRLKAEASPKKADKAPEKKEGFEQPVAVTVHVFHVDWCPHCKAMLPELEKLGPMLAEHGMFFRDVNATGLPTVISPTGNEIAAFPTILATVNKDGQITEHEFTGPRTAEAISAWARSLMQ